MDRDDGASNPVRLTTSVIVAAYDSGRWSDTCEALRSLARQTRPPDEIVLVIDHNSDLLERAQAALPHLTVIGNSGVRGASGARNTGVRASTSDIVAFLDDD